MSSNCSSCSSSSSHSNQKETEFDMKKELTPIFISVTLFLIGLFYYDYLHTNYNSIFEYVIFLIAYFIVGFDILKKSFENIRKGEVFDENFLMSIATIGAILIHALPEAVGVMLFFKVGEFFQELAINNSKKSIKALMDTRPDFANIVTKTGIKKVDPNEILTVLVKIILENNGKVSDMKIMQSSGFIEFDRFMLNIVNNSSSGFPPVPSYLSKDKYPLPVKFFIPVQMVASRM